MDIDGKDDVSLDEFTKAYDYWRKTEKQEKCEEDLLTAASLFKKYDADSNGKMDFSECRHFFTDYIYEDFLKWAEHARQNYDISFVENEEK